MLAESVVADFDGRVRFVSENYGDSKLAERYGVRRYPAIFVDDVLVATPKDFGFFGKDEGPDSARYAPIRQAAGQERFRSDLKRTIELVLAGRPLSPRALEGRVVLVEFWATWCPPCRSTLRWMSEIEKRYGDRLAIVALAMDSDEARVREVANEFGPRIHWAIGSPEIARRFGGIGSVPSLFVFDRQGAAQASFYGAPPTLHDDVEARLRTLLD